MFKMQEYYKIAIIYTLILFLDRINLTILNVAIPKLIDIFQISSNLADWFSVSFLIGLTIAITISSWLCERYGYKKIFIASVFFFLFFSILCAESTNFYLFVISRFLQGAFGGIIIPCGNSILFMSCRQNDYARVTNFVFLPTLLAPAIAPFLGGIIIDNFSYKWIFYINVPICLLVMILSFLIIKEDTKFSKSNFDFQGFFLISLIFIIFFIGSSNLSKEHLFRGLFLIFISFVLGYFFFIASKRKANPIIDFSYFHRKLFKNAVLIQLFFQIAHFGSFFIISLFLQIGLHFSATKTGAILACQALGAILVTIPSKNLYYKIGARPLIFFGSLGVGIATPLILIVSNNHQFLLASFFMLFRGLCSGWIGTPLHTIGILDAKEDKKDVGRMTSIFNVSRQISITLGIALSAFIIGLTKMINNINFLIHKQFFYTDALKIFGPGIILISISAFLSAFYARKIGENSQ